LLKCTLCDEQFAQCIDVEKHVHSSHTGNYKCKKCDEILWTIKDLTSHKKSHAGEISCTFCPKTFLSKEYVDEHVMKCHSDVGKFKCRRCKERFFSSEERSLHMVIHNLESEFRCGVCLKQFSSKGSLRMHVLKNRHFLGEVTEFECKQCTRLFLTSDELSRHMKTHVPGRFDCHICSKRFSTKGSCRRHMLSFHSG